MALSFRAWHLCQSMVYSWLIPSGPHPNLRRSPSYVPTLQEVDMSRTTALFVGIAALTVISTVAEAADGCGRGWYYNGRRCVPQDEPSYPPQYRGPQYEPGYRPRGDYGPPMERGPQLRLGPGREEGAGY